MGLLSRMSRAAKTLSKYYSPFTWRDKPSIESPINAVHLNHMEDGINEMDNRILILAQDKADAADMANVIIDFTMDDTTGVMTFTRFDGSTFTHDTAVEKIALNCYLEGDNFVLELADGTKQKVSLSKFIDTYTFTSTDRIRFTVNGKNISADIPDGKITLAKLEPTVMSTIRQYTLDAQTSKGVAEQAASTAQGWAIGGTGFEGNSAKYYASKSQRYAVGGVEEGDAKDNAKAYCEAAKGYADQCAGVVEFDGTATSVKATDTHSLGSTNVQGQLDALADGLNNIDMSASSVTAVDTQGLAVNAGENSTVQALIDVIANKVMTKLLAKTDIVQVESTATNKVPSSAYLKQVKDSIDSNLGNKQNKSWTFFRAVWGNENVAIPETATEIFCEVRVANEILHIAPFFAPILNDVRMYHGGSTEFKAAIVTGGRTIYMQYARNGENTDVTTSSTLYIYYR